MLGKSTEAEKLFKEVLKLNPEHRECLQSLGLVYFADNRYDEAIEQFRRAVELDSTFYVGWMGLGAAYSLGGMVSQADTVLARLFAVDSGMGFQMLQIISEEHARNKARAADSLK